jgi:hypothetical protein
VAKARLAFLHQIKGCQETQLKILKLLKVSKGDSLDRYYVLKFFGWGIFFHYIHTSDPEGIWHSHPWNGISLFLGSYQEEYFTHPGITKKRLFFNRIIATKHHRVGIRRPMWTLFIHGPKCNQWEIIGDTGKKVEAPWEGELGQKSYVEKLT